MQLTLINFFKRTVPGHIFRGKRRLVRKVTEKEMNRLLNHYKVQENNMLYLKNPYITLVSLIIVVNWICYLQTISSSWLDLQPGLHNIQMLNISK